MNLRAYDEKDAAVLAALYGRAVLEIGPEFYSPAQVAVWARVPNNLSRFKERLAKGFTRVAEVDGQIVGFGQLWPVDYVALLYVDPPQSRQGIAGALYQCLEEEALNAGVTILGADVGKVSKQFFTHRGYSVVREGVRYVDSVALEQAWMTKNVQNG